MLADLRYEYDEIDLHEGVVHLRRPDTDEIAITIRSKGFYDRSITHKQPKKSKNAGHRN